MMDDNHAPDCGSSSDMPRDEVPPVGDHGDGSSLQVKSAVLERRQRKMRLRCVCSCKQRKRTGAATVLPAPLDESRSGHVFSNHSSSSAPQMPNARGGQVSTQRRWTRFVQEAGYLGRCSVDKLALLHDIAETKIRPLEIANIVSIPLIGAVVVVVLVLIPENVNLATRIVKQTLQSYEMGEAVLAFTVRGIAAMMDAKYSSWAARNMAVASAVVHTFAWVGSTVQQGSVRLSLPHVPEEYRENAVDEFPVGHRDLSVALLHSLRLVFTSEVVMSAALLRVASLISAHPMTVQHLMRRFVAAVTRLGHLKSDHLRIGRYSVEKLQRFELYQLTASPLRVCLVILCSPLPTFLVLMLLDAVPMNDPCFGPSRNTVAFVRSTVGHGIMTFMVLLTVKQALVLDDAIYRKRTLLLIACCVTLTMEAVCIPLAFYWRFPVPFREMIGLPVWMVSIVLYNVVFASKMVATNWRRIRFYLPLVTTQLIFFYVFLGLSVGFSYLSTSTQALMIAMFPFIKVYIKRTVWKYASQLQDISTDVTICMVEVSGALCQTVCLQFVTAPWLAALLILTDAIQAVLEVRAYTHFNYIGDGKRTLLTARKIIECAITPDDEHEAGVFHASLSRAYFAHWSSDNAVWKHSQPLLSLFHGARFEKARNASSSGSRGRLEDVSKTRLRVPSKLCCFVVQKSSVSGCRGAMIDGVFVSRRDQARILEQTLRLMFSCEVLLFVEYMEVVIPVMYAICLGGEWLLPNSKYNLIVRHMTSSEVDNNIGTAFLYASLELASMLVMYWVMKTRYGISAFYQLAFLLERYWMTLQGKLVGSFIVVVLAVTEHQGTDFSFEFDRCRRGEVSS
ncbi:hypothetical protein ATCC90586_002802 [Pythium insidiosum]|nr:hypothetical protein ATCC90586_002802 [Pythium insidiosum]